VLSGGVASGAIISSGGDEATLAGAKTVSTTVLSGGEADVYGVTSGLTVSNGGQAFAYPAAPSAAARSPVAAP